MAVDFSRFNFLNRMDARARIFFLVAAVAVFVFIIYIGTRYLAGGSDTTGPSRVATAPQGLTSVQGGQLTPEYQRALQQANVQIAQQAQMTGGSAVPTMIRFDGQSSGCVICSDDAANVKTNLDDWVKQGKVSPDVANALQQLADRNVTPAEYAAELDRLVREGKLTPEQARILLDQYKKQHANRQIQDSARAMDALIKAGNLPLDAANQLLAAQRRNVSPAEYAAMLQDLVRQGKISPETAAQLLAQYTQQKAKEITMRSIVSLQEMRRRGEITPEVEKTLTDLEARMVPFNIYSNTLQQLITAGKITPAVARKILDEYEAQKKEIGPSGSIDQLVKQAEAEAFAEIAELTQSAKITPEVAAQLTGMINSNMPLDAFERDLTQMVQQKKLTSDIAKLKLADYQKVRCARDLAQALTTLQSNNASATEYANALKQGIQGGCLTPEQAAQLMREYQALTAPVSLGAPTGPTTEEFAQLQQRVSQGAAAAPPPATDFTTVQTQTAVTTTGDRQARIDALMNAMAGQAAQLVNAWQPPTMSHTEGAGFEKAGGKAPPGQAPAPGVPPSVSGKEGEEEGGPPLIKAGTILFGVLDTAINSDYPDSPVLTTVVEGKYKGARLLGKIVTTKGVAGQMDRVSINYTLMDMELWPKSKTVTAYAIDPDTARTVMASSVNYHYLMRYGAIMATSFLQGYATAITNAGTATTGIFGTSTTHPQLNPSQKIMVALGQIGQNLGAVTQNYVNIPPTVRVDSGVGLGILFMSDVT